MRLTYLYLFIFGVCSTKWDCQRVECSVIDSRCHTSELGGE